MKTTALLLPLILLLPACHTNERTARLRVECAKCTADFNGSTVAVQGSAERLLAVERGATVRISACRAPNDTAFVGGDTLVTVYADAVAAWIWVDGEAYASASGSALYPTPCVAESAAVE